MKSGMAGEAHFEEQARILEIAHTIGRREHVLGHTGQRIDHDFRRRPDDQSALARAQLHQPHIAQMDQRLADCRAPDAEFAHQVAFGGERIADVIGLVDDAGFQTRRDLLKELLGPDRSTHRWYTCHTSDVNPYCCAVKHAERVYMQKRHEALKLNRISYLIEDDGDSDSATCERKFELSDRMPQDLDAPMHLIGIERYAFDSSLACWRSFSKVTSASPAVRMCDRKRRAAFLIL